MNQHSEKDHTLEHLGRCYENVQNIFRFLDTKAAVVFTIAGIMLGMLATKDIVSSEWSRYLLIVPVCAILGSLYFALRTVKPNHGPMNPDNFTLLFPALHPKSKTTENKIPNIPLLVRHKLQRALTEPVITSEYVDQISHLHTSLVRKISSLRTSITCLVVALMSVSICLVGKILERKDTLPLKIESNSQIIDPVVVSFDDSSKTILEKVVVALSTRSVNQTSNSQKPPSPPTKPKESLKSKQEKRSD